LPAKQSFALSLSICENLYTSLRDVGKPEACYYRLLLVGLWQIFLTFGKASLYRRAMARSYKLLLEELFFHR